MRKGQKATDELRKKLSEAHKGQKNKRKGTIIVPLEIQRAKSVAYKKEWKEKNREKNQQRDREWRAKNRETINAHARARYHRNRQKELDRHRKNNYDIDTDEYYERIRSQNGKCAICGNIPSINLSVDHNHTTGQIRGLICNPCNIAISKAQESPKILRMMADYLESFAT